jgi:acyl-coenzyme A thioesterase PaaI-like protein
VGFLVETLKLRAWAFLKIPLIHFTRPSIIAMGKDRTEIKIPLNRKTRNHLKSMYFGSLAVGADLCVGLVAMREIEKSGEKISLVFKDFKADYKKRALGDVHFICEEGAKARALVEKAAVSKERQNASINGYAVVPSVDPNERVMEFALTLSLKAK